MFSFSLFIDYLIFDLLMHFDVRLLDYVVVKRENEHFLIISFSTEDCFEMMTKMGMI